LARLLRVNAANNIGTRTEHALGVLHTLGTGHALNDDLGIRVEKNSHEKFSSFKSLGVDGYGGISKFSCGAGGFIHGCHLLKLRQVSVFQNCAAQFSIVAVKAHNQWLRLNTFGFQDAECLNNALSNLVAGGNAAEDVDKDGLDLHVSQDHLKTIGHDFRICTAP